MTIRPLWYVSILLDTGQKKKKRFVVVFNDLLARHSFCFPVVGLGEKGRAHCWQCTSSLLRG